MKALYSRVQTSIIVVAAVAFCLSVALHVLLVKYRMWPVIKASNPVFWSVFSACSACSAVPFSSCSSSFAKFSFLRVLLFFACSHLIVGGSLLAYGVIVMDGIDVSTSPHVRALDLEPVMLERVVTWSDPLLTTCVVSCADVLVDAHLPLHQLRHDSRLQHRQDLSAGPY